MRREARPTSSPPPPGFPAGPLAVVLSAGLGLALTLTACASTPQTQPSEPEAAAVEAAATPSAAAPEETSAEVEPPAGTELAEPQDAVPEPAPGSYSVAAGTTLRYVRVVAPLGKTPASVWHGVQTAAAETADGSTSIRIVWRPAAAAAGTEQMGVETQDLEIRPTEKAVRLRLAASAYRAGSAWQDSLLLPPTPGRRWAIPPEPGTAYATTHCEVEAIETVATYSGDQKTCARVVYDRAGVRTIIWWDAQLGLIRTELRDQRGNLVNAMALAGDTWPDRKTALALFGIADAAD